GGPRGAEGPAAPPDRGREPALVRAGGARLDLDAGRVGVRADDAQRRVRPRLLGSGPRDDRAVPHAEPAADDGVLAGLAAHGTFRDPCAALSLEAARNLGDGVEGGRGGVDELAEVLDVAGEITHAPILPGARANRFSPARARGRPGGRSRRPCPARSA